MGENELGVEIDRLLVVLGCLRKLALDEVQLRAVVVDIRVVGVLLQSQFKVLLRLLGVTCGAS